MRKGFAVLALAALLLAGAGLSGCCGTKCCDGNPPCADCEQHRMNCPECKEGKMCDMCKEKMKAMGCPECKDGKMCEKCMEMKNK